MATLKLQESPKASPTTLVSHGETLKLRIPKASYHPHPERDNSTEGNDLKSMVKTVRIFVRKMGNPHAKPLYALLFKVLLFDCLFVGQS